jgi:hypothetical protein
MQQAKYGLFQIAHVYIDENGKYIEHNLYPDVYKNEPIGVGGRKVKVEITHAVHDEFNIDHSHRLVF